jgi:hypothetical protein
VGGVLRSRLKDTQLREDPSHLRRRLRLRTVRNMPVNIGSGSV